MDEILTGRIDNNLARRDEARKRVNGVWASKMDEMEDRNRGRGYERDDDRRERP